MVALYTTHVTFRAATPAEQRAEVRTAIAEQRLPSPLVTRARQEPAVVIPDVVGGDSSVPTAPPDDERELVELYYPYEPVGAATSSPRMRNALVALGALGAGLGIAWLVRR